eukprot:353500-Chlamydomonas_euryale.AAC.7
MFTCLHGLRTPFVKQRIVAIARAFAAEPLSCLCREAAVDGFLSARRGLPLASNLNTAVATGINRARQALRCGRLHAPGCALAMCECGHTVHRTMPHVPAVCCVPKVL